MDGSVELPTADELSDPSVEMLLIIVEEGVLELPTLVDVISSDERTAASTPAIAELPVN